MPPPSDNPFSRRGVLGVGAALIGWGAISPSVAQTTPGTAPGAAPDNTILVTLLGTGSPDLRVDRFGMSTLVQAGGLNLLFDAGRGCTLRLEQAGVKLGAVDGVFITHFHSDHLNGLPDLWMTGYLPPIWGRRARPLEIYGPTGISRIASTLHDTFADDVRIRIADERVPEAGTQVAAHEFAADGPMFERNGVVVTAFEVNHGPLIKPAYGYRIDHAGRSVLLSGDTQFDENLIAHGQGVDLLVHEVAIAPDAIMSKPFVQAIMNHHTTPGQAGTVFTRTKPRLAVFSHIVEIADPDAQRPEDADIVRQTRATWSGDLLVGADLDRLLVTPNGVAVRHYDHARGAYPG